MDLQEAQASRRVSSWDESMEPDVWWSADGIDALIWADSRPYDRPVEEPVHDLRLPEGDAA
jgi:hypothetical protein